MYVHCTFLIESVPLWRGADSIRDIELKINIGVPDQRLTIARTSMKRVFCWHLETISRVWLSRRHVSPVEICSIFFGANPLDPVIFVTAQLWAHRGAEYRTKNRSVETSVAFTIGARAHVNKLVRRSGRIRKNICSLCCPWELYISCDKHSRMLVNATFVRAVPEYARCT